MAFSSQEEENYFRLRWLMSDISPLAARTFFDKEFPPSTLEASLKKEIHILTRMKNKRIINETQWNLLFPTFPGTYKTKQKYI